MSREREAELRSICMRGWNPEEINHRIVESQRRRRLIANTPGAAPGEPSLELIRRSSRGGSATLELYDKPLDLADNAAHKLTWTRDETGLMKVEIDGRHLNLLLAKNPTGVN